MADHAFSCADCARETPGFVCFGRGGQEVIVCDHCHRIGYDEEGHAVPVGYRDDIDPVHLANLLDKEPDGHRAWGMRPSLLYSSFVQTECGCQIVGNGSLQAPLAIAPCREHSS